MEEPDLAYLDESKSAVNLIALVSKEKFCAEIIFKLDKAEVPNCLYFNQNDDPTSIANNVLMIGTTYVRLEEQVPTAGRILFFDPKSL